MRVPLSWLKEYVDITLPLQELAERITLAGLEVERIEEIGAEWGRDKIFVGEVLDVRAHPDADRLTIAVVNYGAGQETVVTGAPNLRVGDKGVKVAFATVGARLIDGHSVERRYATLKPSKIRGVQSAGMVCSEKELGLSDEHEGILLLDPDAPVGTPLVDYLGDTVFELNITPNMSRCLSVIGVAREVAAITGAPLHVPVPEVRASGSPVDGQIAIVIDDPDLCHRYTAALVRDVEIGPSPVWMQRWLAMAGMRPINNIVDISNFVMLEWGQPLHCFDCDRLRPRHPGGPPTIIVRRAHPGEHIMTLDAADRALSPEMLLITDGGGPIAIAGVMGGLESEVTASTRNVLIESANFHSINNRRTSQALKLPSEASLRFGRGIPESLTAPAATRAAELMRELAGGSVSQGMVDAYPVRQPERVVRLRPPQIERIVGIPMDAAQAQGILERLDFTCARDGGDVMARAPDHRVDIEIEADLIEEVARLVGYDRIPATLMSDELPPQRDNPESEGTALVADALLGCGLWEAIGYSLVGQGDMDRLLPPAERGKPQFRATAPTAGLCTQIPCVLAPEACVRLANPLTPEHDTMRTSLLPGLLMTAAANLRFTDRVNLFETGRVYLPVGNELPEEPVRLGLLMTGPRFERSWLVKESEQQDFFDVKGAIEAVLRALGIRDWRVEPEEHPTFQSGRSARLLVEGKRVGIFGEISIPVREMFSLPERRVCAGEFDLEALIRARQAARPFGGLSRYPTVEQDLAIVVTDGVPAAQVEAMIRQTGGRILRDVRLFDVYRGAPVPEGSRSLAYSLVYQADDKTLTDAEVAGIHNKIVRRLERELGATLRG